MKNRKGQIAIWIIVGIAIIALGIYSYTAFGGEQAIPEVVVGQQSITGTGCADSTGVLTVAPTSKLPGATAPSAPTVTCGINNGPITTSVTSGTTTFPVGANLQCLVSKSDFIDESFSFIMPCGGKSLDASMYYSTSDNPGIRIKNDDGNFMTDSISGGAINQTNVAAGETIVLDVEFQGTNTEASGDGIWIIEFNASSAANITSITLAGAESVPIPSVHTLQNAASKSAAFRIPNIIGAEKKTYALSIVLGSGKDVGRGVYTDWYSIQDFIDDDNTLSSGVEDSDGTAKYENTGDYDFLINIA